MSETGSPLIFLGDPRLASYATGDVPAWLWSADATRILWGNPAAAALFNASSSRALTGHTIDPKGTAALQIARLAGSLPHGAPPRLERLRGFGGRMGGALMCACSRIVLADRTPAILVVATEASGPHLALPEQAKRLLAGCDESLALFAADGSLLHATPAAAEQLAGITSLAAIGAGPIAATAFASGHAERANANGKISLYRIGTEASTLLLAHFEAAATTAEPIEAAPPVVEEPTVDEPSSPEPPSPEPAFPEATSPEPAFPEPASLEPAESAPVFESLASLASRPAPQVAAEARPEAAPQTVASEPAPFYELASTSLIDVPPVTLSATPVHYAADAIAVAAEPIADPPIAPPAEPAPELVLANVPPNGPAAVETPAAPVDAQRTAIRALAERRQPLRFVWQMDADGRFTLSSEDFAALIGPNTAAVLGQSWDEIAKTLALDPEGHVARAFASHNTWSGITVSFPVDSATLRLPVELSGLPVFDRDRNFRGYRGFGICRAIARIAELALATSIPAKVEPPVFREEPTAAASAQPAVNVVPFRSPAPGVTTPAPAEAPPTLTPVERHAFTELATRLTARLRGSKDKPEAVEDIIDDLPASEPAAEQPVQAKEPAAAPAPSADQRPILDRVSIGVLVYRLDQLIYANRAFLDWTGYQDLHALRDAGGLDALFVEPAADQPGADNGSQALTIATNDGDKVPVEARLFTATWEGESALVLMLTGAAGSLAPAAAVGEDRTKASEAMRNARSELRDARVMLEFAADGVVVLNPEANVISVNRCAQDLFGYNRRNLVGLPFATLFAEESQASALEAVKNAAGKLPGRDVIGRMSKGGLVPLFMTASLIHEDDDRICVIFRDMTPWKKTEGELLNAKRQAEKASSAKSDFLAKISHEIRTPLNAIIGFAEVMMQERFGPIGNDRYQQYLKDIHTSGDHLLSLLNDLLDLSKIEAGKLELNFTRVDLNELIQQSVALVQPQANRERIIIRTALGTTVPTVTADARSVRQILLNLLSNSIKFTGAGGQVIVSTALGDDSAVVLRVRDTGIGMSEQDIAVALEPFRQLATSGRFGSGGTGLGLPLTKALAEANRASFKIKSAVNTGTLVEVAFPAPPIAAE